MSSSGGTHPLESSIEEGQVRRSFGRTSDKKAASRENIPQAILQPSRVGSGKSVVLQSQWGVFIRRDRLRPGTGGAPRVLHRPPFTRCLCDCECVHLSKLSPVMRDRRPQRRTAGVSPVVGPGGATARGALRWYRPSVVSPREGGYGDGGVLLYLFSVQFTGAVRMKADEGLRPARRCVEAQKA